jgi:predicted RNA binding protein YcfA (HicA-like mRNA interferase family)
LSHLKGLSWREIERALKKAGFIPAPARGKGSHLAFYRVSENDEKRLVIVPRKKDIPIGTVHAIIKQAGLSVQGFIDLLG